VKHPDKEWERKDGELIIRHSQEPKVTITSSVDHHLKRLQQTTVLQPMPTTKLLSTTSERRLPQEVPEVLPELEGNSRLPMIITLILLICKNS